jgi:hypothetical protein
LQAQALRSLAQAQAAIGDIAGATQSLNQMTGKDARAECKFDALLAIAQAQVKAGDLEDASRNFAAAQAMADAVIPDYLISEKWLALTRAETAANDAADAKRDLAADLAWWKQHRPGDDNQVAELGRAQADAGDFDGAMATAIGLPNPDLQKYVLGEIEVVKRKALPAAPQPLPHPVDTWVTKLDDSAMRWERGPTLSDPIIINYTETVDNLKRDKASPEQKFEIFNRYILIMTAMQQEVNDDLRKQFKM